VPGALGVLLPHGTTLDGKVIDPDTNDYDGDEQLEAASVGLYWDILLNITRSWRQRKHRFSPTPISSIVLKVQDVK
jgi:hypothetical protein